MQKLTDRLGIGDIRATDLCRDHVARPISVQSCITPVALSIVGILHEPALRRVPMLDIIRKAESRRGSARFSLSDDERAPRAG